MIDPDPFANVLASCQRIWMSESVACWQRWRLEPAATVALPRCRLPPALRPARSAVGEDLTDGAGLAPGRVRRAGGGRKPLTVADPGLLADLMALVEPGERGDPMSPLR